MEGRISSGLEDENADRSRAAAYLLTFLGRPYVWPGEPAALGKLLDRAIARMESLAADDSYLSRFDDREGLLRSVAQTVGELQLRRNEIR